MLKLDSYIRLDDNAIKAPNLTDRFSDSDLQRIGNWVHEGYEIDKLSRKPWERRTDAAMDLAMQVTKAKSFPWPNSSNIAFPLVTIGAMQFHARAYPSIINGTDVVKMRVVGPDPTGDEHKRATRVSEHMSYQVLEQDSAWEEQHDRLLLITSIVGCAFIKTYFDPEANHNVSELVMARDFVINYWAKSVESCYRKTHRVPLTRNDIRKRVLAEIYRDVLEDSWYQEPTLPNMTTQDDRTDKRTGQNPPGQADETTPYFGLEQHCWLDLDDDGYAEPYIVLVEEDSRTVLRIVSRVGRPQDIDRVQDGKYRGQIMSIRAEEFFTKYSFIPSPDGGIYDVGFGVLLGPLNESVNSLINQLVDAGTISNTAGGFLGRGAKIRGGVYVFSPFAWNRVDSSGDDLRKNMVPLPVREPSMVLFQLLGLIINYTNRISGANDTIVGENPGQNTPAQTTQTMVEMGMKIYNAIFKRIWRSMKEEFKKLYILNGTYMSEFYAANDEGATKQDFMGDPNKIVPAADPSVTSDAQILQQAMLLKQNAMATPGYNQEEVERRLLRAMKVDDSQTIYPGVGQPGATPPGEDVKITIEKMKQERDQALAEFEKMKFMVEMKAQAQMDQAEIMKILSEVKLNVEQASDVGANTQIQAMNVIIGMLKHRGEQFNTQIDQMLKRMEIENDRREIEQNRVGTVARASSNKKAA